MSKIKKYCSYCRSVLINKKIENRMRLYCDECSHIYYENPIPASAVVVLKDNEILLVRRGVEPCRGGWCLPGGFLEIEENVVECCKRELLEETGLSAGEIIELGSSLSLNSIYKSVLIGGGLVRDFRGEIRPGDDAVEVNFFPLDDHPEIVFKSHKDLLNRGMKKDMALKKSVSKQKPLKGDNFGAYVISSQDHIKIACEASKAGTRIIQYRDKKNSKKRILEIARELREITNRYKVLLIINDHIDIALGVHADGIHLGQDDLPLREAIKLVPSGFIIGISTHSMEQAIKAEREGADYIGIGPVFKTPTKEDYLPIGLDLAERVVKRVSIPVVAIGGLNLENISLVQKRGIKNFAMVREFQNNTARTVKRINSLNTDDAKFSKF